jgi:hypothetical protein
MSTWSELGRYRRAEHLANSLLGEVANLWPGVKVKLEEVVPRLLEQGRGTEEIGRRVEEEGGDDLQERAEGGWMLERGFEKR